MNFIFTAIKYTILAIGAITYIAAAGTAIIYFLAWDGTHKVRHTIFGVIGMVMMAAFIYCVVCIAKGAIA